MKLELVENGNTVWIGTGRALVADRADLGEDIGADVAALEAGEVDEIHLDDGGTIRRRVDDGPDGR